MKNLTEFLASFVQKRIPDAFVIALYLSAVVVLASLFFTELDFQDTLLSFGNSFWSLLTFSMQMVFILVIGHCLALSNPVQKLLKSFCALSNNPRLNILLVFLVSSALCWLNWGLGLVGGALLAKSMKLNHPKMSFPLLISAAYSGFLVWHSGLSGSIPLKLTSPGEFSKLIDLESLSLNQTVFTAFNFVMLLGTLAICSLILFLLSKSQDDSKIQVVGEKFEQSGKVHVLALSIGLFLLGSYLAMYFSTGGGASLNIVNLVFLFAALAFHGNISKFLSAFKTATGSASGIILQFPIYAGIMGVMKDSGLGLSIAEFFVSTSNSTTFPMMTFWGAGVLNFFVPSGGGQWAIQGPIVMKAAAELGVSPSLTAMSVAWGDAWTNMIQPFWALPLLSIAGLHVKDIIGYLFLIFIGSGVTSSVIIYAFS